MGHPITACIAEICNRQAWLERTDDIGIKKSCIQCLQAAQVFNLESQEMQRITEVMNGVQNGIITATLSRPEGALGTRGAKSCTKINLIGVVGSNVPGNTGKRARRSPAGVGLDPELKKGCHSRQHLAQARPQRGPHRNAVQPVQPLLFRRQRRLPLQLPLQQLAQHTTQC